jgi:hypothetical protein
MTFPPPHPGGVLSGKRRFNRGSPQGHSEANPYLNLSPSVKLKRLYSHLEKDTD